MATDPRSDAVAKQYQNWQYPEPIHDLNAWLVNNWQWFDPKHAHRLFWPDRDYQPNLDILVAGCGTSQAAVIAYTNPDARVVAVDVSEPSLDHHRQLKRKHGLNNLELHCLPLEEVPTLQRDFDLVISTGVLHHLADPKRGLQALAECLRPDGVAAIMVYASYGRIGVDMLKAVFADLGLRQDEASLAVLKAAIASLPPDHPLNSYLALAPDLQFDAGLIDTFLHGRDRTYTVADCLDLVNSAGLVFQDWFIKSPYYPDPDRADPFSAALAGLPIDRQWAVMERINHRNGCHFFTACRPERPVDRYRVDFTSGQWLNWVPEFRYRCALQGKELSRPGWTTTLGPQHLAWISLVDGRRQIREIVSAVADMHALAGVKQVDLENLARATFEQLWQRDVLAMRLVERAPEAAPHASTNKSRNRPSICLNMIVRNESHIIRELIDSVARYIDTWVIVDTGSDDGTPDLIRGLLAERGIPGELHHRPWRDFGHNRSEALALAQGHADYIWVMDADDTIVGSVDFSRLTADAYSMRFQDSSTYWRRQLFRDGVPWRYEGVLHEAAVCDQPVTDARLEGHYHIHSRRLGARNQDPLKYARDAAILQAEVDRNPANTRAVFYLAQSCRDANDLASARHWYERRASMGGWEEEVYCSLFEVAKAMDGLGEPWPAVQDAYLRAWEYRPTRAEPLHAIACRNRSDGRYLVGLLFAQQASAIPCPSDDALFVNTSVYEWRALDELAVCASWLGLWEQTIQRCEQILSRDDIPSEDRQRIEANRTLALQRLGTDKTLPLSSMSHHQVRSALVRRLMRRTVASGQITLPAVPALLDEYLGLCEQTFAALGVDFSDDQRLQLRDVMARQLAVAWAESPRSEIAIHYQCPVGLTLSYEVKPQWSPLSAAYDNWVATRQPPYFGTLPDAKVWALAQQVASPENCTVLDLGAGTGRNALALARRGHPVDAVELSDQFATILRAEATKESLPVRVIHADLFSAVADLRSDYGLIIASEVVSDFRSPRQLKRFLEMAAAHLRMGGHLLFNIFLARPEYEPDAAAKELGQQLYTSIFTYVELEAASAGLPLQLISDEAVLHYEKQNLPQGTWPPTGWYAEWVSGLDVFDVPSDASPIEMRWIVFERRSAA